jgi:hypothetical protein
MSADYVGPELQSEFGKIPPSFLPLGNRRLFQHQTKLAPKGSEVYISVPEEFKISVTDMKWLDTNDIHILKIPSGLTLGESLIASLNLSSHSFDEPIHILFGDTLFIELPLGENLIGMSEVKGNYNWASSLSKYLEWARINSDTDKVESVVNGYFKISSPRALIRCITKAKWDLYMGLNLYNQELPIEPVKMEDWMDFGHVNTYYKSKASFTTQRAFNELTITPDWIEKKSVKNNKIIAEANWFENAPYSLSVFTPQYLGKRVCDGVVSYKLEYLYQTALNELYVFGVLPEHVWEEILSKCVEFLKACEVEVSKEEVGSPLKALFCEKTSLRLLDYCNQENIRTETLWTFNNLFSASIDEILSVSAKYLPETTDNVSQSVMHGDFCFSNILYDFRTGRIKVIDPRGMNLRGEKTIFGDIKYDIAKLSHSILGLYDYIISGYYKVDLNGDNIFLEIDISPEQLNLQRKYINLVEREFGLLEVNLIAMQIQLFLSMLPLHSDDKGRQKALFANVFRLYSIMKELI